MQHCAILGDIDRLAGEHGITELLDPGGTSQVEQEPERGVVHPMLRVVDMEIADGELQTLAPGRIGGEQVAEMDIGDLGLMGGQRPPLRCAVDGFGDF